MGDGGEVLKRQFLKVVEFIYDVIAGFELTLILVISDVIRTMPSQTFPICSIGRMSSETQKLSAPEGIVPEMRGNIRESGICCVKSLAHHNCYFALPH